MRTASRVRTGVVGVCGMPPSNLQALGSPAGWAIRAARHMPPTAASLLSRKLAKAWQKDDADTTRVLWCKCCWYGVGKNNNELTNIKTDSDPILALHLRARCGLGSVLLTRRRRLLLLPLPRRIRRSSMRAGARARRPAGLDGSLRAGLGYSYRTYGRADLLVAL